MRLRAIVLFSVLCATGYAQDPLSPPLVGWLRDGGRFRAVYGVAGNFLPGPLARDGISAAGFSGTAGAIKTDSAIILVDRAGRPVRELDAPPGRALFAFNNAGQAAWCYFPDARQLLELARGEASLVDLSGLNGTAIAVGASGEGTVQLLVTRGEALWKVTASAEGQILSEEPLPGLSSAGPALLVGPEIVVVGDGSALVIRRGVSDDQRVTLPAPAVDLELMGDGWIRIGQPDGPPPLALRLSREAASLYRLPAGEAQP